ncbi:hypothetical protein LTR66_011485 [Elasticomyces elasticus]|nr:hypothetical protein LTR66_011485 [Elasticomyces elasticus]
MSSPPPMSRPPLDLPPLYPNPFHPISTAATISSAPVTYANPTAVQDKTESAKKTTGSLRYVPHSVSRPKPKNEKASNKPAPRIFPNVASSATKSSSPDAATKSTNQRQQPTLADFQTNDDDVNGYLAANSGGRKNKYNNRNKNKNKSKKRWEEKEAPFDYNGAIVMQKPTPFNDYKESEVHVVANRQWHDRLHVHRKIAAKEAKKKLNTMKKQARKAERAARLANNPDGTHDKDSTGKCEIHLNRLRGSLLQPVTTVPTEKAAGEDADAQHDHPSTLFAPPASFASPPSAPSGSISVHASTDMTASAISSSSSQPHPVLAAAPAGMISRAPVRYERAVPASDTDDDDDRPTLGLGAPSNLPGKADVTGSAQVENPPRPKGPGQKYGVGRLMMQKMGWEKGQSLGVDGGGILEPLRVVPEKRKRAEGGGFAGPSGIGKILGGKRLNTEKDEGKTSNVVLFSGLFDGMSPDKVEEDLYEGDLMQRIGDKMNECFGRLERHKVNLQAEGGVTVLVKFNDGISALRAVTAIAADFEGKPLRGAYYDAHKFEAGSGINRLSNAVDCAVVEDGTEWNGME